MRSHSPGGEASGEHILFERPECPAEPVHAGMHDPDCFSLRGVIQLTL